MLYLFNRFLPYFSSILLGSTFAIWTFHPEWIVWVGVVVFCIIVLSVWSLTSESGLRHTFWQFVWTPLVFIGSGFFFYLFIDDPLVRWLFIGGLLTVYMLILKNIFSFIHHAEQYQPYALENIYGYVNMLSLFLFTASAYGASVLLGWTFWPLALATGVLASFLYMRTLWSHKIPWEHGKLFIMVLGIVTAELAYIVSLLPTAFVMNALLLVSVYYVLMNTTKDYLKATLNPRSVRTYVLISAATVVIALLTTKWI